MQRAASSLRRSLGSLQLGFNGNPIPHKSHSDIEVRFLGRSWRASIELEAGCRLNSYATKCTNASPGRAFYSRTLQNEELKASKHNDQADNQNPQLLLRKRGTGAKLSAVDKRKFLINTLLDLKDSKESVYGTLDAWVAWENNFPLPSLKDALVVLEKAEQWHRVVQVIKWMLSKGQGTTRGTYEQLIRALEKDNRAEEAHGIWVKKISYDLHSVPWRFCELMISIYYRNNMLDRLVKLFEGLESYDRRPPSKLIVQRVADAYEMLGLLEEKNRVLAKYSDLFSDSSSERFKKSRKGRRKNDKKQEIDDTRQPQVEVLNITSLREELGQNSRGEDTEKGSMEKRDRFNINGPQSNNPLTINLNQKTEAAEEKSRQPSNKINSETSNKINSEAISEI